MELCGSRDCRSQVIVTCVHVSESVLVHDCPASSSVTGTLNILPCGTQRGPHGKALGLGMVTGTPKDAQGQGGALFSTSGRTGLGSVEALLLPLLPRVIHP